MLIDRPTNSELAQKIIGAIEKQAAIHRANAKVNPIVFVATNVWEVISPYFDYLVRQTAAVNEVYDALEIMPDRVVYHGLEIRHQPAVEAGIVIHVHPPDVDKWELMWAKRREGE